MKAYLASLDAYDLAVWAVIFAWCFAALVAFIVITLRKASVGGLAIKLCGGYERAVQILHAVAAKRKEREQRPPRQRPALRMVKK